MAAGALISQRDTQHREPTPLDSICDREFSRSHAELGSPSALSTSKRHSLDRETRSSPCNATLDTPNKRQARKKSTRERGGESESSDSFSSVFLAQAPATQLGRPRAMLQSAASQSGLNNLEQDTQPLPQTFYDEQSRTWLRSQEAKLGSSEDGVAASNGQSSIATPRTFMADNSGHINLLENFQPRQVVDGEDNEAELESDGLEVSPNVSQRPKDSLPDSLRFQRPFTPATNKARRFQEQPSVSTLATSTVRRNPFGSDSATPGNFMGLTQAFDQISSPIGRGQLPETLSDRPSPDDFNDTRTLDAAFLSSPIRERPADFHRALTEPSSTYVRRIDSQNARTRRSMQEFSPSERAESPGSDPDSIGMRQKKRQRIQKIDDDVKKALAEVKIPGRAGLRTPLERRRGLQGRVVSDSKLTTILSRKYTSLNNDFDNGLHQQIENEDNDTECETQIEGINPSADKIAVHRSSSSRIDKENATRTRIDVHNSSQLVAATQQSHLEITQQNGSLDKDSLASIPLSNSSHPKMDLHGVCHTVGTQTTAVQDSQPLPSQEKRDAHHSSLCPLSDPVLPVGSPVQRQSEPDCSQQDMSNSQYLPRNLRQSPHGNFSNNKDANAAFAASPSYPRNDETNHPVPPSPRRKKRSSNPDVSMTASPGEDKIPPIQSRNSLASFKPDAAAPATPSEAQHSLQNPTTLVQPAPSPEHRGVNITQRLLQNKDDGLPFSKENLKTPLNTRANKYANARSTIPETSPAYTADFTSSPRHATACQPTDLDHRTSSEENYMPENTDGRPRQCTPTKPNIESAYARHKPSPPKDGQGVNAHASYALQQISQPRIRTLSQIAADSAPQDGADDLDVDFRLLSSADAEFEAALGGSSPISPKSKRRKSRRLPRASSSSFRPLVGESTPILNTKSSPLKASQDASHHSEAGDPTESGPDDLTADKGPRETSSAMAISEKPRDIPETVLNGETNQSVSDRTALSRPDVSLKTRASKRYSKRGRKPQKSANETSKKAGSISPIHVPPAPENCGPEEGVVPLEETIICPNRIFALFKGLNSNYYPATFLRTVGPRNSMLEVCFDDGTIDTLEPRMVRSLDVRRNDIFKVDLPQMRTRNYIVTGFEDKRSLPPCSLSTSPSKNARVHDSTRPPTDIRGFANVLLIPKPSKSTNSTSMGTTEPVTVPVSCLYIVQSNLSRFRDREFYPTLVNPRPSLVYPAAPEGIATLSTPSSRRRTVKTPTTGTPVNLTSLRTLAKQQRGLFENMIFAVTYAREEEEKLKVRSHIVQNGGTIAEDGFAELFNTDGLELPGDCSFAEKSCDSGDTMLRLTQEAQGYGFTCVIADRYSRKAKFIEGLALGLPCLSGRWIQDCVAKGQLLSWEPYLLAAGDSSFLGAVCSRFLQPYPAASARLATMIESRPNFLHGRSVLLIIGKSEQEEKNRKASLFLTYAIGAARVGRVPDLEDAKLELDDALRSRPWDWVYLDSDDLDPADRFLSAPAAMLKRKRNSAEKYQKGRSLLDRPPVRVVGNDFVVQSLIIGKLLED
ncbi:MAG: hypothetical protein M4579_003430 [Chaenotheca gracillima]|nr:MAG: hypothetical protein M4579_003430 [Chaenotheca gracillima]